MDVGFLKSVGFGKGIPNRRYAYTRIRQPLNPFAQGDWVYNETKRGRVRQKANYSRSLNPLVVCADLGWWFPEEGNYVLHRGKESNINILFDDQSADSPATVSLNLSGLSCRVYTAFEEYLPKCEKVA